MILNTKNIHLAKFQQLLKLMLTPLTHLGHMRSRNATLLTLALVCASCAVIPLPGYYLLPSAPEGQAIFPNQPIIKDKMFMGQIKKFPIPGNPKTNFLFNKNDINILVHASRSCAKNSLTVYVAFQVPEGNLVEIMEPIVKVADGNSTNYVEAKLLSKDGLTMSNSMVGITKKGNDKEYKSIYGFGDIVYSSSAQFSLPDSDTYKLVLPKAKINGNEVELPEIVLTKQYSYDAHHTFAQCWW